MRRGPAFVDKRWLDDNLPSHFVRGGYELFYGGLGGRQRN
jgi:hypothetical protein